MTQETETKTDEALAGAATDSPEKPSLMVLAGEAVTVAKSFLELASLELRLALESLPKIVGLFVVIFLLALFAWLSFSAAVGWLAFAVLGTVGWGIAGFLLIQIVALIICRYLVATHLKRLSLPNTRDFVKTVQENFRDAAR